MTNGAGHRATPRFPRERLSTMRAASGSLADAEWPVTRPVLPLALAGLAALGHRGAFGADGASSDGAEVSLPSTDPSLSCSPVIRRLHASLVFAFLPRGRSAGGHGSRSDRTDLRRGGHARPRRRRSVRSRRPRARGRCSPTGVQPGGRGASGGGVRRRSATTPSNGASWLPADAWRAQRGPRAAPSPSWRSRLRRAGPWSTRASSRGRGSPSCTPTWPNGSWSTTPSSTSVTRRTRIPYLAAPPSPSGRSPTRRDQHRPR